MPKIEEGVLRLSKNTIFYGDAIWNGIMGKLTKAEQFLEERNTKTDIVITEVQNAVRRNTSLTNLRFNCHNSKSIC